MIRNVNIMTKCITVKQSGKFKKLTTTITEPFKLGGDNTEITIYSSLNLSKGFSLSKLLDVKYVLCKISSI